MKKKHLLWLIPLLLVMLLSIGLIYGFATYIETFSPNNSAFTMETAITYLVISSLICFVTFLAQVALLWRYFATLIKTKKATNNPTSGQIESINF